MPSEQIRPSGRPTIHALTGLRIVAAGWVVAEHFRMPMFALLPVTAHGRSLIVSGYLGVEIFFMLSGFILSYQYADHFRPWDKKRYRRFLGLRLARIYPVHLVTLVLMVCLVAAARAFNVQLNSDAKYTPISLVMNVPLLQAIPPAEAWNGPAWSISAEAAAYLIFPAAIPFIAHAATRFRVLLGIGCSLLTTMTGLILISAITDFSPTSYPAVWVRIAGEFTAGCFIWSYWSRFCRRTVRWDVVTLASTSVAFMVLSAIHEHGVHDFVTLPLLALVIAGVAGSSGPVRRVLSSRVMQYGGKVSYSLYMTHFIVLMIAGKLLPWENFESRSLPIRSGVFALYLLAIAASATATYHLVEEPGRRLLRRWVEARTAS